MFLTAYYICGSLLEYGHCGSVHKVGAPPTYRHVTCFTGVHGEADVFSLHMSKEMLLHGVIALGKCQLVKLVCTIQQPRKGIISDATCVAILGVLLDAY